VGLLDLEMSVSAASDPEPATTNLQRSIDAVLADPEFPALSQQIHDILDVLREDDAPARKLAAVVLQDYGLTLKVLRMANSFQYNRSNTPIESVSHAIVVLGVHTVRALAGTLLLFDHYQKRSEEMRQLMLLSIMTAHHARATAEVIRFERVEEAYLCGMFRNLGEVLVASHFPADHRRILAEELDAGKPAVHACFRVMRFYYEDLAAGVAKLWQLPPLLFQGLSRNERPGNELQALIAFSHDLTSLLYRRDADDAGTRLHLLLLRYSPWLTLSEEKLKEVLERAVQRTAAMFGSLNLSLDALKMRSRFSGFASGEPDEDGAEASAAPLENAGASQYDLTVGEIERLLTHFEPGQLVEVLQLAVRAVYALGVFDRVLLAEVSPDRRELVPSLALGDEVQPLTRTFRFQLSIRGGAVGLAVMRQQDLVFSRDQNASGIEAMAAETLGVHAYGVYPVAGEGEVLGCLYVDSLSPKPPWGPAVDAAVKRVRSLIGAAHAKAAALGGRVWTPAEKLELVLRLLRGEDVSLVSRETRLPARDLEQWKRAVLDAGLAQLQQPGSTGRTATSTRAG
jgi:HD-like signal output (HDOD) protein